MPSRKVQKARRICAGASDMDQRFSSFGEFYRPFIEGRGPLKPLRASSK